jgi:integrase
MGIYKYRARNRLLFRINERIELPDGAQFRCRERGFKTEQAAKNHLAEVRNEMQEGVYVGQQQRRQFTVKAAWEFFEVRSKRKHKSYVTSRGRADHLITHLGSRPADSLTEADIDDYRANRLAEKSTRDTPPAVSTVEREVALLKAMLNWAVKNRKLRYNPIHGIEKEDEDNKRDRILTIDEFKKVYDAADDTLKMVILLAFTTGLRKSSVANLKWSQIDLSREYGRINLEPADVKRHSGVPVIVLTKRTTAALRQFPTRFPGGYVFANPRTKRPWTNLDKQFKKICAKAKVPYGMKRKDGVIFHDLRRSFITNSRRSGVDERTIMSMSGHKTREAHDRYHSLDDTDQREAAEKIERMLDESLNDASKKVGGE